jgi:hypothetical protein
MIHFHVVLPFADSLSSALTPSHFSAKMFYIFLSKTLVCAETAVSEIGRATNPLQPANSTIVYYFKLA